jgi:3-isopropylmalate/(R)-2-methylmalate dehydratase small subunit
VPPPFHQQLLAQPEASVHVDLATQTISIEGGASAQFPVDEFSKTCLLEGVDELGFLLKQESAIAAYEARRTLSLNTLA